MDGPLNWLSENCAKRRKINDTLQMSEYAFSFSELNRRFHAF